MPLSITPTRRRLVLALTAAAAALAVTACGGGDDTDGGGGESSEPLTFWTLESEPNRVARTEANLERFTEETGIEVELVTVEETAVPQQMITNAASGTLPDVVTRYGNWGDRQILVCGGPGMVEATKAALIAKGAPAERIQHDPLAS